MSGRSLKELITLAGLTQTETAKRAGMTLPTLNRSVTERRPLELRERMALWEVLGCPPELAPAQGEFAERMARLLAENAVLKAGTRRIRQEMRDLATHNCSLALQLEDLKVRLNGAKTDKESLLNRLATRGVALGEAKAQVRELELLGEWRVDWQSGPPPMRGQIYIVRRAGQNHQTGSCIWDSTVDAWQVDWFTLRTKELFTAPKDWAQHLKELRGDGVEVDPTLENEPEHPFWPNELHWVAVPDGPSSHEQSS